MQISPLALAFSFVFISPFVALADNPTTAAPASTPASTTSSPTASGASAAALPDSATLEPKAAALFNDVSKLIKEYYPNAKPVIKGCHYRVQYKSRSYDVPQTNSFDIGPDWGGLVVDLELKPGPYDGVKAVPCQLNEFSYYVVLLFGPYSQANNCHLLARISHPFDVPPDFLARLKQLVNGFDQHF